MTRTLTRAPGAPPAPVVPHGAPLIPAILVLSLGAIGVSETDAHQLWAKAWASEDFQIRSWRFMVDHTMYAIRCGKGSQILLDSYLSGAFSARVMIDVVERLWHEYRLSRQQANAIEEAMLRHTGKDGRWLAVQYRPRTDAKPDGFTFKTIPDE